MDPWLLAPDQSIPGSCRYLGNETVDGRWVSVWLLLSSSQVKYIRSLKFLLHCRHLALPFSRPSPGLGLAELLTLKQECAADWTTQMTDTHRSPSPWTGSWKASTPQDAIPSTLTGTPSTQGGLHLTFTTVAGEIPKGAQGSTASNFIFTENV